MSDQEKKKDFQFKFKFSDFLKIMILALVAIVGLAKKLIIFVWKAIRKRIVFASVSMVVYFGLCVLAHYYWFPDDWQAINEFAAYALSSPILIFLLFLILPLNTRFREREKKKGKKFVILSTNSTKIRFTPIIIVSLVAAAITYFTGPNPDSVALSILNKIVGVVWVLIFGYNIWIDEDEVTFAKIATVGGIVAYFSMCLVGVGLLDNVWDILDVLSKLMFPTGFIVIALFYSIPVICVKIWAVFHFATVGLNEIFIQYGILGGKSKHLRKGQFKIIHQASDVGERSIFGLGWTLIEDLTEGGVAYRFYHFRFGKFKDDIDSLMDRMEVRIASVESQSPTETE